MPRKAKRICNHPGCRALVDSGYCEKHKKQNQRQRDQRRGTAHERGYDARWRTNRELFLKCYPLCAGCLKAGKVTPASVVDHIIPHKGNKELFWDRDNWQSLCKRCHDIKTVKEDGGFGNRVTD